MFAAVLIFLFLISSVVSDCPAGEIKWPDNPPSKCYSLINVLTSFDKAELACISNGGHLASIHDGFTNSFLREHATYNFTSSTTSDFWIGAKKPTYQSNWTWTDQTIWDFSECQNLGSGNGEACVAALLSTGLWNARDCGQLKPYICETNEPSSTSRPLTSSIETSPTTTVLAQQNCTYPWQYFDNSCYYWANDSNWEDGEAFCVTQNSHLVSIHSSAEIEFILSIVDDDLWIWTGLYTNSSPVDWNSTWQYTDNSNVDFLPWAFPYYYPIHNGYQCVQAYHSIFENFNCSNVLSTFCKKDSLNAVLTTPSPITTPNPLGNCLNGWSYNNQTNSCYLATSILGNFTTTENFCKTFQGGHLSSFKDSDEFVYLNYLVYGANPDSNQYIWFGLYSDDDAITWKFTDGTPLNFIPWAIGYPVKFGYGCASSLDGSRQLTNANSCNSSLLGICKMPSVKV